MFEPVEAVSALSGWTVFDYGDAEAYKQPLQSLRRQWNGNDRDKE
jgi:hypothetical protein